MARFDSMILIFLTFLSISAALADYALDGKEHPCKRTCRPGEPAKVCEYTFVVERYLSMSKACYDCPYNVTDCFRPHCISADGVKKVVYSINRQVPGPTNEVCENDIIQVQVINRMLSESTSMHWHGIRQVHTPLMDGTPLISQCPILPGQQFLYNFTATDSGTFLYHSHTGFQGTDGLVGAVIVHKTSEIEDNEKYAIDGEHFILVEDWTHKNAADNFEFMHHDMGAESDPSTLLINGLGRRKFNDSTYSPTAEFVVEQGKNYRFRVIQGGFDDCPVRVSIDNHEMQVISLDGNDIEPVTVDAMTMWSGERADFVLKADQETGVYFIRFMGSTACRDFGHQVAFLRYQGSNEPRPQGLSDPHLIPLDREPRILNPFNRGQESASEYNIMIPDLRSLTQLDDPALTREPNHQFHIVFDFYNIDHTNYQHPIFYSFNDTAKSGRSKKSNLMNYISMQMPTIPLMSEWELINNQTFCSEEIMSHQADCLKKHCECTHKLDVTLNSVVELILVDEGTTSFQPNHPFHLHGYFFRVIAEQRLDGVVTVDRVKQLDREGKIKRNLKNAPMKDTTKVSSGGFAIIRFYANNPGYWLFHCHVEQHSHAGMALLFKVGEHRDFPPVPKDFPKCGGHYFG